MKILLVGAWDWPVYEESFSKGLVNNGCTVEPFFLPARGKSLAAKILSFFRLPTPQVVGANKKLLRLAAIGQYDLVILWRCIDVFPSTVRELSRLPLITATYNNDDPFGGLHGVPVPLSHHFLWKWYRKGIRYADLNFFYRKQNLGEARELGAKHADILMPYFIPWRDKPAEGAVGRTFEADVVFVGHYESDGRDRALVTLAESGRHVRVWGDQTWSKAGDKRFSKIFGEVKSAVGPDYARAIAGGKIALCFLSKINRDVYTRRCFEIPAIGSLLLAERTPQLEKLFEENVEAVFFDDTQDLCRKVDWLLSDHLARDYISSNGQKKVWAAKHDVNNRAADFISKVKATV